MTRFLFGSRARWLRWSKAGFQASLLVLGLLAGPGIEGQTATLQVRQLAREGNASEFLSPLNRTAVLVDGGKAGPGNKAFDTSGTPALKRLWDQGYRKLMIICSHPHADHAGKLREIIGYVARSADDVDLTRFESVVLVDSEYRQGKSLFEISRDAHGEVPSIQHADATRIDIAELPAVKALFAEEGTTPVRTLPYEPAKDAPIHGRALITETTLRKDGETLIFLDPDDAENEAIRKALTERGKPEVGLLVLSAPHHGSRYSDLSIFKGLGWKPDMVVFQANAANSFDHPHAESWWKAAEQVGVKNVIITGAGGREIVFDGTKPQPLSSAEVDAVVETILIPKIAAYEREETRLSEELAANGSRDAARRREAFLEQGRALRKLAGKYNLSSRRKTPPWVLAAVDRLPPTQKPPKGDRPPEDGAPSVGNGRPRPGRPPGGGQGNVREAGGENYNLLHNSSIDPASGAAPTLPGVPSGSGGRSLSTARTGRFNALTRGYPIFGGIVLGNSVEGPPGQVVKAHFTTESVTVIGEERTVPILEVLIQSDAGQKWYRYDDWTPGELWSAYFFVKPKNHWTEIGAEPGGGGLVGKAQFCFSEEDDTWCFGIHPAIANTPLAIDAMALDWLIASLDSDKDQNEIITSFLADKWAHDITNYQWMSSPSRIQTLGGNLSVVSSGQDDNGHLLKLRLVPRSMAREENPESAELSEADLPTKAFVEEAYRQFAVVRRIDRFARSIALLNWLSDAGTLPPPPKVEPNWLEVQPEMSLNDARHHLGLASLVLETPTYGFEPTDLENTSLTSDDQEILTSDLDSNLAGESDPGVGSDQTPDPGSGEGDQNDESDHRFVSGIGFTVLGFGLLSLKWYKKQEQK